MIFGNPQDKIIISEKSITFERDEIEPIKTQDKNII